MNYLKVALASGKLQNDHTERWSSTNNLTTLKRCHTQVKRPFAPTGERGRQLSQLHVIRKDALLRWGLGSVRQLLSEVFDRHLKTILQLDLEYDYNIGSDDKLGVQ